MNYILYNSLSNNQIEPEYIQQARKEQSEQHIIQDVVGLDYVAFFDHLKEEDSVTLVGGDGTIHYLVNALGDYPLKNKIYLVPAGSGNDFFRDVATDANQKQVLLNPYLSHLPVVEVAGMKKRFINGIGFGIDGYYHAGDGRYTGSEENQGNGSECKDCHVFRNGPAGYGY